VAGFIGAYNLCIFIGVFFVADTIYNKEKNKVVIRFRWYAL